MLSSNGIYPVFKRLSPELSEVSGIINNLDKTHASSKKKENQ